jgi:CelD/BcsL family acetyltransferase involved in cellulose biosynthesis
MDLRETWNKLLEKSSDNNVFLTWEWLSTWWRHYGQERQLVILLAEEHDRIIAIAPLMYSVYRLFGPKLRKIEFIGASKHTDYSNFILTENMPECLTCFIRYLIDYPLEWDCLEFRGMPERAESLTLLRAIGKTLKLKEKPTSACSCVPLPNSPEKYFGKLSGKMRQNLRRCLRRLREMYDVQFVRYYSRKSVQDGLKTLLELHQKRWKAKGRPGLFSEPAYSDFLSDIAQCFAQHGWLNLSALTANNRPIASDLCFEYNEKLYAYNKGFDPEYTHYSPGSLLLSYLIEDSIRRGLKEFDFLRGTEEYKNSWNAAESKTYELTRSRGLLGGLYQGIKESDNLFAQKLKSVFDY